MTRTFRNSFSLATLALATLAVAALTTSCTSGSGAVCDGLDRTSAACFDETRKALVDAANACDPGGVITTGYGRYVPWFAAFDRDAFQSGLFEVDLDAVECIRAHVCTGTNDVCASPIRPVAPGLEGDRCLTSSCAPGFRCSAQDSQCGGTCERVGAVAEACPDDGLCGYGMVCVAGFCRIDVRRGAALGERCAHYLDEAYSVTAACIDGACVDGVCAPYAAIGDACEECYRGCSTPSCDPHARCVDGRCAPLAQFGEACDLQCSPLVCLDTDCAGGVCVGGVCVPPAREGDSCWDSCPGTESLYCVDNVCRRSGHGAGDLCAGRDCIEGSCAFEPFASVGVCEVPDLPTGAACHATTDCAPGHTCCGGVCIAW